MNPARKRVLGVAIGVVPLSRGADSSHDTVLAPAIVVRFAAVPEIVILAPGIVRDSFPESTNTDEWGTESVHRHDPFKISIIIAIIMAMAAYAMSSDPDPF